MPELPEVEILKRSLKKNIRFAKIEKVRINNRNLRYKVPGLLGGYLKNEKICDISRISKYLLLHLKSKKKLLIHLGMSGTIHLLKNKNLVNTNASFYHSLHLPQKHNHIEIFLSNGLTLVYNDPRRFGYLKVMGNNFLNEKPLRTLGPDPFSSQFNNKYIKHYIKNKKKNIKNLIMDQNFVSGIGNIYANEILFYCHLSPIKKISDLNRKNIRILIINIRKVLKKAILFGGSSIKNFKKTDGKPGNFQQNFKVYGKSNAPCLRSGCSGYIKRISISNRSTFYCLKCQK